MNRSIQICFAASIVASAIGAGAKCGRIKPGACDGISLAPQNHRFILENDVVRAYEATIPAP
jgi:hypothetical protein